MQIAAEESHRCRATSRRRSTRCEPASDTRPPQAGASRRPRRQNPQPRPRRPKPSSSRCGGRAAGGPRRRRRPRAATAAAAVRSASRTWRPQRRRRPAPTQRPTAPPARPRRAAEAPGRAGAAAASGRRVAGRSRPEIGPTDGRAVAAAATAATESAASAAGVPSATARPERAAPPRSRPSAIRTLRAKYRQGPRDGPRPARQGARSEFAVRQARRAQGAARGRRRRKALSARTARGPACASGQAARRVATASASTNGCGTRASCARAPPRRRSPRRAMCGSTGRGSTPPASAVRPGDVVTVALDRGVRVLKVTRLRASAAAPPSRRRALYEDLAPWRPPTPAIRDAAGRPAAIRARGRPTKQERRAIERFTRRATEYLTCSHVPTAWLLASHAGRALAQRQPIVRRSFR